jgi:hypothetical protein
MNRLLHFLRAESKTLIGIALLLALVAWVWTSSPPPRALPPAAATAAPSERLDPIAIGATTQEVLAILGPPTQKRPLPAPNTEAWIYPAHHLQADFFQDRVTALRARVYKNPLPDAALLAAQGLLMDPSIEAHPNLSIATVGKLSVDWRRLDKYLNLRNPRRFKISDTLSWTIYPGIILITYNDDPKQQPKLAEIIITPKPIIPEAWAEK